MKRVSPTGPPCVARVACNAAKDLGGASEIKASFLQGLDALGLGPSDVHTIYVPPLIWSIKDWKGTVIQQVAALTVRSAVPTICRSDIAHDNRHLEVDRAEAEREASVGQRGGPG